MSEAKVETIKVFSPLLAFCEMHHDKLIEGGNDFGPKNVKAFLWSKIDTYQYAYAQRTNNFSAITLASGAEPPLNPPSVNQILLRRVPGKTHGYCLYILEGK